MSAGPLHVDARLRGRGGRGGSGSNAAETWLHAIVIGEPFQNLDHLLQPIAPHAQLPFALLPICNTPLIDYVLENLFQNRAHSVTVLVREGDTAVREHLEEHPTAVGQSWMKRYDTLDVQAVLPALPLPVTFHGVARAIVKHNLVAQNGSFLLFPINAITAFSDLYGLFQTHLKRVEEVPKYAATVLCTPTGESLQTALYNVLDRYYGPEGLFCGEREDGSDAVKGSGGAVGVGGVDGAGVHHHHRHHIRTSSSGVSGAGNTAVDSDHHHHHPEEGLQRAQRARTRVVPTFPKDFHTILAFEEETGVVSHMSRFEAEMKMEDEDEDSEGRRSAVPQRDHRAASGRQVRFHPEKQRTDSSSSSDDDGEEKRDSSSSSSFGEVEDEEEDEDAVLALQGSESGWNGVPAKILFGKKVQGVRMDLIPTSSLFLCNSALGLTDSQPEDVYSYLNGIISSTELLGNCFGFVEMPRCFGMLESITSMDSYIRANLDVCGRRFYPMTRESCFAEAQLSYEVAPWCETVYLHTTPAASLENPVEGDGGSGSFPRSNVLHQTSVCLYSTTTAPAINPVGAAGRERTIGPYVVVGEGVQIPWDIQNLSGVCCDKNVQIGRGASLVGCVLLEGAVIGARCHLRYVLVGKGAVVEDDITLIHCMVEHGATVTRSWCHSDAAEAAVSLIRRENAPLQRRHPGYKPASVHCTFALSPASPTTSSMPSSSMNSLGGGSPARNSAVVGAGAPLLQGRSATRCRLQNLVLLHACGVTPRPLPRNPVLPTEALFVADPIPMAAAEADEATMGDDLGDDCGADDFGSGGSTAEVQGIIRSIVGRVLAQPSSLSERRLEITSACVSHQFAFPQLCRMVTQLLVEHLAGETENAESEEEVMAAATALFSHWLADFYRHVLDHNPKEAESMMCILEGLCLGATEDSNLYISLGGLVEVLHNGCRLPNYHKRCGLVSMPILKEFADKVDRRIARFERKMEGDDENEDSEDSDSEDSDESSVENPEDDVYLSASAEEVAKYIRDVLLTHVREHLDRFHFLAPGSSIRGVDDSSSSSSSG